MIQRQVVDIELQAQTKHKNKLPGVMLVLVIAFISLLMLKLSWVQQLGLSSLTIAILVGIAIGNTVFPQMATPCAAGVDFSRNQLLRAGVILFGFKVTFQQVMLIGLTGLLIDVLVVATVFSAAYLLGTKIFRLDKETSILIGAGSSICGAAAILATEPVIKAQSHKISVAIATVVVFGTVSMFLYPLLYPYLHLSEHAFGIYAGSTIHEVAQVVGAGVAVSEEAASIALIEKMLRVMLLVPFLFIVSGFLNQAEQNKKAPKSLTIPWFAVLFVVATAVNSLAVLPEAIVNLLIAADTLFLTMAMAALGLRTHIGALRQAGVRPLLLALVLFILLTIGGYILNLSLTTS